RANHEGLADHYTGPIANRQQLPRFRRTERDGLLAEDVLSGLRRPRRPGNVQVVGKRVIDDLYLWIGEQLVVRPVRARDSERVCGVTRALLVTGSDGDDLRPVPLLQRRDHL